MDIEPGKMYTLRELAEEFQVSERTLTRKLEAQELRGYKVGAQWRIKGRDWLSFSGVVQGPHVYVVANAKGGAGKSTFTANLAVLRAQEGRRVLLLDLDPQGHLATLLRMPVDPSRTTAQLLDEELRLARNHPQFQERWHTLWSDLLQPIPHESTDEALSRVFLVPAHNDLQDLERANFHRTKPVEYALKEAITALSTVRSDIDEIWIVGAIKNRAADDHWWVLLIAGLAGVGASLIALAHPEITALVLVLLIGANALVTGVLDLVIAIRLRRRIHGELLLVLSGIASIVFGVVVFLYPLGAGALALVWLVGLYAIATGVLLLALAMRLRAWAREASPKEVPNPS